MKIVLPEMDRSPMLKPYSQILRHILSDRAGEIETNILAHDPKFRQLNSQIRGLLNQIQQNLPPGLQNLVLDLDDHLTEEEILAHELMYLQGVKDGLNFRRFLKRCEDKDKDL
jgi:hypothetical protein